MTNTEESTFMVLLVGADFSSSIPLKFYESLSTRAYGKEENGDTASRKQLNKVGSLCSGFSSL